MSPPLSNLSSMMLFLMYAKMCIFENLKTQICEFLNISEQLMYLPPKGSIPENIEVKNFLYLKYVTSSSHSSPGERRPIEENTFVEWSCLLGRPQAGKRSFSQGKLEKSE